MEGVNQEYLNNLKTKVQEKLTNQYKTAKALGTLEYYYRLMKYLYELMKNEEKVEEYDKKAKECLQLKSKVETMTELEKSYNRFYEVFGAKHQFTIEAKEKLDEYRKLM